MTERDPPGNGALQDGLEVSLAPTALLKLATWLSPSYPVSAYAYSHGLETAVADGAVNNAAEAQDWIEGCLRFGAGRTDAILLAAAFRATGADLLEIAALATALAPSAERLEETRAMGHAFAATIAETEGEIIAAPYPVALGQAAARAGAPLPSTLAMFLHAFTANLVSAAIRLVPLGQVEGQKIIAALAPVCVTLAAEAEAATLDDIGGAAQHTDITAMRHEAQEPRIFRS